MYLSQIINPYKNKFMEILSLYFVTEGETGEKMGLKVQALYTPKKEKEFKERAKKETFKLIDKGLYLSRWELYRHPNGAKKPYLDKYKIDCWN